VWVQFAHFKEEKWLDFNVFGTLTDKVRRILFQTLELQSSTIFFKIPPKLKKVQQQHMGSVKPFGLYIE